MDGMILISTSWAKVLFDTGATHSFISEDFLNILRLETNSLERPLFLHTPIGEARATLSCHSQVTSGNGEQLDVNLIVLPMTQYDVILGMDWLSKYRAQLHCYRRRVTLHTGSKKIVLYRESQDQGTEKRMLKSYVGGRRNLSCYALLSASKVDVDDANAGLIIPVVDKFFRFPGRVN